MVEHMQITNEQKQKIEKIGEDFNLKLLLLYGSCAKDAQRKGSDLDIAFLSNISVDFDTYFKLYSSLEGIFGDKDRDLDIVDIRKKDPLFLYQIAKNSQLLHGNRIDYSEFLAFAFRNYTDSKDLRDLEKTLVVRYQKHLNALYAPR